MTYVAFRRAIRPAPWTEAARVILAHISDFEFAHDPTRMVLQAVQYGSESLVHTKRDFCVLLLKPLTTTKLHLRHDTFPGGTFNLIEDMHKEWVNSYLKWKRIPSNDAVDHMTEWQNWPPPRPPMFKKYHTSYQDEQKISQSQFFPTYNVSAGFSRDIYFPPELAFRMCALRMLYAQTGLLAVHDYADGNEKFITYQSEYEKFEYQVQRRTTEHLQELVSNNSTQWRNSFLSQQRDRIYPDLTLPKEWSNWLSPATLPNTERFDTMFYVVVMNFKPKLNILTDEDAMFVDPEQVLLDANSGKVRLEPSTFYELSRLLNFDKLSQVDRFASRRERQGCSRLQPTVYESADGKTIYALPGDDLHVELDERQSEMDNQRPKLLQKSASDSHEAAQRLHRMEMNGNAKDGWRDMRIFINVSPQLSNDHVMPVDIFNQ